MLLKKRFKKFRMGRGQLFRNGDEPDFNGFHGADVQIDGFASAVSVEGAADAVRSLD